MDLYHDKNTGIWKQGIVKEAGMNVEMPTKNNRKYNRKNRMSDLDIKNTQEKSD